MDRQGVVALKKIGQNWQQNRMAKMHISGFTNWARSNPNNNIGSDGGSYAMDPSSSSSKNKPGQIWPQNRVPKGRLVASLNWAQSDPNGYTYLIVVRENGYLCQNTNTY